jgi:hypothetical protein
MNESLTLLARSINQPRETNKFGEDSQHILFAGKDATESRQTARGWWVHVLNCHREQFQMATL